MKTWSSVYLTADKCQHVTHRVLRVSVWKFHVSWRPGPEAQSGIQRLQRIRSVWKIPNFETVFFVWCLCHLGFVFLMLFVLCFLRFFVILWYCHVLLSHYVTFTSSCLSEMFWECLWCRSALSIFEETYCLEIRTSEITVVTNHFLCRWISNNHVVTQ